MPGVRLADRRIWVGDQSRALLSGEVHFWRLDPSVWPAALQRLRELGLDVLSTYVCWNFHELDVGQFDFVGATDSRRNLLGFLELAAREGFWVLLRPGPYIYAEWPNSGIPERVVQHHRLHPQFVAEARVWMSAVVSAVRDGLATNGGPIVMLQADNEADPWFDVYGPQLGLSETPGLFQEFLRDRYGHIADLNFAWGADFDEFADARAVLTPNFAAHTERYLDSCRFRHWYATEVVRWTTAEYRRLGVDVPIYTNTYIDTNVQDWRVIADVCDLVGPDVYPSAAIASNPDEHRRALDAIRYARCVASMAFVPEFESGIWHGWHTHVGTLSATNYELNGFSALQAGASGWNWYMLVGRDSWYMSPITEQGRFRPELSRVFSELVRVFRVLDPTSLQTLSVTSVTFNALERAARLDDAGETVLRALYAADIDHQMFDLDSRRNSATSLLIYAGGTHVSPAQVHTLIEYVEGGGTLVLFQPPAFEGIARAPGGVSTAAAPQRVRLSLGDAVVELSSPSVYRYAGGEPITAERIAPLPPTQEGGHAHVRLPIGERLTVGYLERRGQGRIVVLGLEPTPELLAAMHGWLGVRIPSRATSAGVHSAVFRRGRDHFVILTNTSSSDQDAVLRLDIDAPVSGGQDLRSGASLAVIPEGLLVRVPAHSGTALRLS